MNTAEPDDEDLIRGCRANNRKSQEMLYRRYARTLFNMCLFYENDRDKAKDILQESFIKIFMNINGFNGKGSLTSWMKRIITHTAIDQYRKDLNATQFVSLENITYTFSYEETIGSIMNTKDIISQIDKLPRGARMIFQLYAIEGYSHKEIASLLHISVGTSKSQISRAKQLLKQWITETK